MLSSDTRMMGCFVDVVWYDLNVTPDSGRGHSHFELQKTCSIFLELVFIPYFGGLVDFLVVP